MQKTFWWSWNSLVALAVALMIGGTAQAEDTVPSCRGIRPTDIQPAAQDTWPIVARNAFAADGAAPRLLTVTLLVPVVRGDHPPCLAAYLVDSLTRDGNGVMHGRSVPTSMDTPALFYEPLTVDPAMIADWDYRDDPLGLMYGDFRRRSQIEDDPELMKRARLAETALPPEWSK